MGPTLIAVLVGWAFVCTPLLLLTIPMGREGRAYAYGLWAAIVAFVVVLAINVGAALAFKAGPSWVFPLVVSPLVEETVRVSFLALFLNRTPSRANWLLFGVGYGLPEASVKLLDFLVMMVREDFGLMLAVVTVAFVPFLLHVFLSLAACRLLYAGAPPFVVFVVCVLLHGGHNWSALYWTHEDAGLIALSTALRSALFVGLIALLLWRPARAAGAGG